MDSTKKFALTFVFRIEFRLTNHIIKNVAEGLLDRSGRSPMSATDENINKRENRTQKSEF